MIVFCEDCGKRHSVTEGGDENGRLQFRCDACGFLITVTSVPPKKREAKAPDASVNLTCPYDEVDFGVCYGDDVAERSIFVAAMDGRKVELEGKVSAELKGNVSLESVAANAFKVSVVAASKMGADLLDSYNGPGLEFFDGISGALLSVPVLFNRDKPVLAVEPSIIDLGKIEADVLVEGCFTIKNCTATPLAVTVAPDPKSFSLTSFLALTSDSSWIMAGGEKRDVLFSIRSNTESKVEVPFEQILLVSATDSEELPPFNVRIIASQKPFSV